MGQRCTIIVSEACHARVKATANAMGMKLYAFAELALEAACDSATAEPKRQDTDQTRPSE